MAQLPSLQVV